MGNSTGNFIILLKQFMKATSATSGESCRIGLQGECLKEARSSKTRSPNLKVDAKESADW